MKPRKDAGRLLILLLFWAGHVLGKQKRGDSGKRILPSFAEPIRNVTSANGRSLSLACVVENLEPFKVSWIHIDRHMLLTLHDTVITRNPRFHINHNGHSTWVLHITDVRQEDQGQYMCQINTNPMISQSGYVRVVVPPKINEEKTSSDKEVKEGSHVTLHCRASGIPTPNITWRREDNKEIILGRKKVTKVVGNSLTINNVKRTHMGAYLCIASNQVQPSVSKRIVLSVKFSPMIWTKDEVVGAAVGTSVTLECHLESYPSSVTYWTRNENNIIISDSKYDVMPVEINLYKVEMRLRIRQVEHDDFGSYTCHAKNSLGEVQASIKLHGIPPPVVTTTETEVQQTDKKFEGYHFTTSDRVFLNNLFPDNRRNGDIVTTTPEIESIFEGQFPVTENNMKLPEKGISHSFPNGASTVKPFFDDTKKTLVTLLYVIGSTIVASSLERL